MVLLCLALLTLGGAALKGWEKLTAEDPWYVRADQVCLDAGNEYVNVEGSLTSRLRQQVKISQNALDHLRKIGNSVSLSSTLKYQTMLSDKEQTLSFLRRQLHLREGGRPDGGARAVEAKGRMESVFDYVYRPHAEELGLNVCGQDSGKQ